MSMNVKIQAQAIEFRCGGKTYQVTDPHPDALTRIFEYGTIRFVNDKAGGLTEAEKDALALEWVERIQSGDVGQTGGGGARLSPLERAQRGIVKDRLVSVGWKAGEADKAARDPQAGFLLYIRELLAAKNGVPLAAVTDDDAGPAARANWEKVVNGPAQAIVDAAKGASVDIEV